MKKISGLFGLVSAIFATVPGITVLSKNIGVPPNSSAALFAGTIETIGIMTLLIMWINRESIHQKSIGRVTKTAIVALVVFLISLLSYLFIYNYYIEDVPNAQPLFFPFWAEGDLKKDLLRFGSRIELINQWGRDDVYKEIQESSKIPLLITTLVFLVVYQLIFTSLTFAFGLLGIKGSTDAKKETTQHSVVSAGKS